MTSFLASLIVPPTYIPSLFSPLYHPPSAKRHKMDTTPSSTSFQVLDDAVSVAEPIDVDTEPDDEVDQLESDSDHDDPDGRTAGSSSKKSGPKCDVRIPGNTFLPAERLESIIQADGETDRPRHFLDVNADVHLGGVGSLGLSKEGLFVLSIATVRPSQSPFELNLTSDPKEELIKRLAQCGLRHASTETRTTLAYGDTGACSNLVQSSFSHNYSLKRLLFSNTKNCSF